MKVRVNTVFLKWFLHRCGSVEVQTVVTWYRMDWWWALVNTVMNYRFHNTQGILWLTEHLPYFQEELCSIECGFEVAAWCFSLFVIWLASCLVNKEVRNVGNSVHVSLSWIQFECSSRSPHKACFSLNSFICIQKVGQMCIYSWSQGTSRGARNVAGESVHRAEDSLGTSHDMWIITGVAQIPCLSLRDLW